MEESSTPPDNPAPSPPPPPQPDPPLPPPAAPTPPPQPPQPAISSSTPEVTPPPPSAPPPATAIPSISPPPSSAQSPPEETATPSLPPPPSPETAATESKEVTTPTPSQPPVTPIEAIPSLTAARESKEVLAPTPSQPTVTPTKPIPSLPPLPPSPAGKPETTARESEEITTPTPSQPPVTPTKAIPSLPPLPSPADKPDSTAAPQSKDVTTPTPSQPPVTPIKEVRSITIPSYARWFSFDGIFETELRAFPEFFNDKSSGKTPVVYLYLRDFIVKKYRENPARKITFTQVRRMLVADVGSIRRVFDFLEGWGLINYAPATKTNQKTEDKEKGKTAQGQNSPAAVPATLSESARFSRFVNPVVGENALELTKNQKDLARRLCSSCKYPCNTTCFECRKANILLCGKCYIRDNCQAGLSAADFKRIDLTEEVNGQWNIKETQRLLEATMWHKDNWRLVADYVGSRSETECIYQFLKLPFGEQFQKHSDPQDDESSLTRSNGVKHEIETNSLANPTKKRCLSPLADASNPIMAQAAFLSAMVGPDAASAAARSAVAALERRPAVFHSVSDVRNYPRAEESSLPQEVSALGQSTGEKVLDSATLEAGGLLDEEEKHTEDAMFDIVHVQMKEFQDRILCYEDTELLMEKESLQLNYMKSLLFADQLNCLPQEHQSESSKSGIVRPSNEVT